ncbi:MAG TPA: permease-like cell division protein FtsX [Verrucomicrobiae bacterium]|nr:permease-like cell division protein FtsX [Verrucomicrobiae bacterium]
MLGFFRFVTFSVTRGLQGLRRNGLMTLAATSTMLLMLLLLAGFWLVQAGLAAGVQYVEQKVEVVADLHDVPGAEGALTVQAVALASDVAALPSVRSVTFVSKDEALSAFRDRLRQRGQVDLTGYLDRNPLPASLEVKLVDPRDYQDVVQLLQNRTHVVDDVVEVQKLVQQLTTVTGVLRTGGFVLLVLVGFVVLFIIVNTIRLAVVARREEIEVMRLVGASDAFIRWPFIFEGAFVGLLGAGAALAILAVASGPMTDFMYGFFRVLPLELGSLQRDVIVLVLGTGLGVGILGSWLSVRSYLAK